MSEIIDSKFPDTSPAVHARLSEVVIDVVALDDHVAEVDTNAEIDPEIVGSINSARWARNAPSVPASSAPMRRL